MRVSVKVGVGALALASALTGCASVGSGPQEATVAKVINGNSVDVTVDGTTEHILLLNLDTPEAAPLNGSPECLGPEASQFLTAMLPAGTPVSVEFDAKAADELGHNFAALFTQDGKMVNAELARAGFAQAVTLDGNAKFRPQIDQAAQEAADNKRGLHSADVPCTVPGQVAALGNSVAQGPTLAVQPPDADSHALFVAAGLSFAAVGVARSLLYDLDHAADRITSAVLTELERSQLLAQTQTAADTVNNAHTELQNAANAAKAKEVVAAQQAAQAEVDRVAREQAAAQEAERQRVAAEVKRQADAQAAEQRQAAAAAQRDAAAEQQREAQAQRAAQAPSSPSTSRHTGQTGHPCMGGERDGDHDGYCGEGR